MWYGLGLLLLVQSNSQVLITLTTLGEVHFAPSFDQPPYTLLANLTSPQSAVGNPNLGLLFLCSEGAILKFEVNYTYPEIQSPGTTVYDGGYAAALAMDLWGNVFFVDSQQDCVGVLYAQGAAEARMLYNKSTGVDKPIAIAVDDFYDDIFWGNIGDTYPGIRKGVASPSPQDKDSSPIYPSYLSTAIDGLALTHNLILISTADNILKTYKHFPQSWVALEGATGKVLAGSQEWVYVQSRENGTVVRVGENGEVGAEGWGSEGVTGLAVMVWSSGLFIGGLGACLGLV